MAKYQESHEAYRMKDRKKKKLCCFNTHLAVAKFKGPNDGGRKEKAYHKSGNFCGIVNSYTLWSDLSEKQYGNLAPLKKS